MKTAKTLLKLIWWLLAITGNIFMLNGELHLMNYASDVAVAGAFFMVLLQVFVNALLFKGPLLRMLGVTSVCCMCVVSSGCYKIIPPGHAGITVQQTGSARGVNQIPVETGRVFYNPFNEDVLDYPTFVQRAIWTASASEGKKDESGGRPNEEIAFQSKDSLHFTGDVAVAYQLVAEKVPHFYVQFRSDDLENFTHGFFRDAVRKSIGIAAQDYTQEEINGGKQADLEHQAEELLRKSMENFGVNIVQLAFTSPPRPPDAVKQAIQGKVAAIQRAEQIENEKRQAVAEGAKTVALAEAQAKANITITSSITPTLLQWEQIKVMQNKWNGQMPMVSGGGNPLMLQLPK